MKKKVLFLAHTLAGGGAERILVNLVNNLDREKFDITVMTVINTGIYISELRDDITYKSIFGGNKKPEPKPEKKKDGGTLSGVLSAQTFIRGILNFFYTRAFALFTPRFLHRRFIREHYDTEVAFLEGICTKIISGGDKNDGTRRIGWVHVDIVNQPRSHPFYRSKKQETECYRALDKIVAVSDGVKKVLCEYFGEDLPVDVKYNPVCSDEILRASEEQETDVVFGNDLLNLVTVGRLIPQKGYDRLIRVHKRLFDAGYRYHLYFIGEGPMRDGMNKFIEKNGLSKYTHFLGYRTNPHKYVAKCDVFVCSSRAEGFSTVATEAVILGVPIVTVNCSGMGELLCDGEYGIICGNDEDSLYNTLVNVLNCPKSLDGYREKLWRRAEDFSLESSVANIAKIL